MARIPARTLPLHLARHRTADSKAPRLLVTGMKTRIPTACTKDANAVKHGDRHRHFHVESIQLGGDAASVDETEDFWVIADTGLTTEGVMNWGFKARDELARTWMLANGIPFTHDHPRDEDEMGLVVDMRRVGGWIDNVRFDDETGNVVGDVYLAKRPLEGLEVTEENIRRNRVLVTAIKAGEDAEVSIGFWSTDIWQPGTFNGDEYDWRQTAIVYDHLAQVPVGACSWEMGCGMGRHQNGSEPKRQRTPDGVGGARGHMPTPEAEHQDPRGAGAPGATGDCARGAGNGDAPSGDGGLQPAAPAAPAAPAEATGDARLDAALKRIHEKEQRLDAALKRLDAQDTVRLDGKRQRLANLQNVKVEDLPALDEAALDSWIKREESLRGKADPPIVGGNGRNHEGRKILTPGVPTVDASGAVKWPEPEVS